MNVVEEYLNYARAELGLAETTITKYQVTLENFERLLRRRKKQPLEATERDITAFVSHLEEQIKKTSISSAMSPIRNLYRFAIEEELTTVDPTEFVDLPQRGDSLPRAVSESEIRKFLRSIRGTDPLTIRDRAMVELLYSSGIRRGELVATSLRDLNIEENRLTVFGKGRKQRVVPIGKYSREALSEWLDVRSSVASLRANQALFVNHRGGRLTGSGLNRIVGRYAEMVRLQITPHVFRHSCATHMLDHGADIMVIKELLGHSSIMTTQKYTSVSQRLSRETLEKAHPRYKENHV